MKISYAITVCNELKEIKRLIGYLVEGKRREDEIVILFDSYFMNFIFPFYLTQKMVLKKLKKH